MSDTGTEQGLAMLALWCLSVGGREILGAGSRVVKVAASAVVRLLNGRSPHATRDMLTAA